MAATDHSAAVRVWTLATFRVTAFVLAVVLYLHLTGSLRERLARLDTVSGAASFVALWALTWYVTRVSLRWMGTSIENASSATIIMNAIVAGGWNGVGVFLAVFGVGFVYFVARMGPGDVSGGLAVLAIGRALLIVLGIVGIGGPLSFTIGAIVGLLSGLFEALLLGLGSMVFSAPRGAA
jgi:hypothetical protein